MKKCNKCGSDVLDTDVYCQVCGSNLDKKDSELPEKDNKNPEIVVQKKPIKMIKKMPTSSSKNNMFLNIMALIFVIGGISFSFFFDWYGMAGIGVALLFSFIDLKEKKKPGFGLYASIIGGIAITLIVLFYNERSLKPSQKYYQDNYVKLIYNEKFTQEKDNPKLNLLYKDNTSSIAIWGYTDTPNLYVDVHTKETQEVIYNTYYRTLSNQSQIRLLSGTPNYYTFNNKIFYTKINYQRVDSGNYGTIYVMISENSDKIVLFALESGDTKSKAEFMNEGFNILKTVEFINTKPKDKPAPPVKEFKEEFPGYFTFIRPEGWTKRANASITKTPSPYNMYAYKVPGIYLTVEGKTVYRKSDEKVDVKINIDDLNKEIVKTFGQYDKVVKRNNQNMEWYQITTPTFDLKQQIDGKESVVKYHAEIMFHLTNNSNLYRFIVYIANGVSDQDINQALLDIDSMIANATYEAN